MTKRIKSLLDKNLPKFTETVDVNLPEVPKINLPKLEKV
jgi:hypothetical protein